MQAYAYEGFFENGQFYIAGQTTHIKGRKKAFITILDEPEENDDIKKMIAEFDRMVDESSDEILLEENFQRLNSSRPLVKIFDEEA
jgi:predicted component of type VI protein secretion system